jgi:hypothetical protein
LAFSLSISSSLPIILPPALMVHYLSLQAVLPRLTSTLVLLYFPLLDWKSAILTAVHPPRNLALAPQAQNGGALPLLLAFVVLFQFCA